MTLVGWDDSFPAENWPEGRRPPADGAWIAKNSWGRDWGNDGFFLLSYYDKTICGLHSFDYIVDYQESNQESLKVLAHDIMPATILNETSFDKPVYGASVFTVDEDCCLQYVSAITGTLKNTLTACIYLLDEDATDPTRGTLLQSASETFPFAGYHLLKLGRIPLKKGSRIGVVIEDTVPTESGIKHSIFISCNYNEQGALLYNETRGETGDFMPYYGKAKINRGESYICLDDGIWMDWVDAVDYISSVGNNRYLSFDNLPIKAYLTADNAGIQQ